MLDELGIERTDAIGMSLGAKTLLHPPVSHPCTHRWLDPGLGDAATPRALRARCSARGLSTKHAPEEWAAMRAGVHVHGDAQIAALWEFPRSFADDAANDLPFSREPLARVVAAPKTLIVSGDRDPLYPVELAVDYAGHPAVGLSGSCPAGATGRSSARSARPSCARRDSFLGA